MDRKPLPTRPHSPSGTRQPKWAAAIRAAFASYADAGAGSGSIVLLDDLVSVVVGYCEWSQRVVAAGTYLPSASAAASNLQFYDWMENRWIAVHAPEPASFNISYSGVNVVVCGEYLYAIGGSDTSNQWTARSTVRRTRLDGELTEWKTCAAMNSGRTAGYPYVCDDRIFMFGGCMHSGLVDSLVPGIEVYHPTDDAWDVMPYDLNLFRPRFQMSVIRYRDRLYALGGFGATNYSVESISYDALLAASERVRAKRTGGKPVASGAVAAVSSEGWELEPDMNYSHEIGPASFVYRDTIFSITGSCESLIVERYCPPEPRGSRCQWEVLPPFTLASLHLNGSDAVGTVTLFNEHFILITFHEAASVAVVDLRTAPEWTIVTGIPPMPIARRFPQAAVLPY